MKTYYQRWNNNEAYFNNNGSFLTKLFYCYQVADLENKQKLKTAFPEYFIKLI